MGDLKACNKCAKEFPATAEFFHRLSRSKDGLWPTCKTCRLEYEKQNRDTNLDYRRAICERARAYRDANIERVRKRENEAYHSRRAKDPERVARQMHESYMRHRERRLDSAAQWRSEHRDELRAYFRRYHREHAERIAARSRDYYQREKDKYRTYSRNRKARKKAATGWHSAQDVAAQNERQRHRCYWCGASTRTGFHVDHIVPLKLGGTNWPDNIVIACPRCNLSKGAKHPMDFAGVMF